MEDEKNAELGFFLLNYNLDAFQDRHWDMGARPGPTSDAQ
jgi:hypothetical protein